MNYNVKESGKRIKELRKAKGYTQESFADEIGIAYRTYCGIEAGIHSTCIENFTIIAKQLDTTLDYLILGKGNEFVLDSIPTEKQEFALKILKGILDNI